jgi:hypothetical protein
MTYLPNQPVKSGLPIMTIVPNSPPKCSQESQEIDQKWFRLISHFCCALSVTYIHTTDSVSIFIEVRRDVDD